MMVRSDKSYWRKLVLRKLKGLLISGDLSLSGSTPSVHSTLYPHELGTNDAREEDVALAYLNRTRVITADFIDTEIEPSSIVRIPVRADEHDKEVWLLDINLEKFSQEVTKFGLYDNGIELIENNGIQPLPLPQVYLKVKGGFSIHQANVISYKGQMIELEPQVRKIAAFMMERSFRGLYTDLNAIIDSCLSEQYLAKAAKSQNEDRVPNYVRRSISRARTSFRIATGSGEDRDFFPNTPGVGYMFVP